VGVADEAVGAVEGGGEDGGFEAVLDGLLGWAEALEAGAEADGPDVGVALGLVLLLGPLLALLPGLGVSEGVLLALPLGFALALGVGDAEVGPDEGVGVAPPPSRVTTASDGGSAICAVQ
jgi:hypothetical protein